MIGFALATTSIPFDAGSVALAGGVAAGVTLVCLAALATCRLLRGHSAALRHGLLVTAVIAVILAPALSAAVRRAGWGGLRLERQAVRPAAAGAASLPARPASGAVAEQPTPVAPSLAVAPPAAAAGPAAVWPSWLTLGRGLICLWLGGIAIGIAAFLRELLGLRRFLASLRPCTAGPAQTLLGEAATAVGLARPPRLCVSPAAAVPLVAGPLHPVVVLPAGIDRRLPAEQLSAVLVHEAAHIAHGDLWIGLLQRIAATLFWWCPPLHRLNRRLADLREERCDNHVLHAQGHGLALAQALVDLAAAAHRRPLVVGMVGTLDERAGIVGRVERLVRPQAGDTATRIGRHDAAITALFAAAAAVLVVATTIRAADAPAPAVSAEVRRAIDTALEWLADQQAEDGGWTFGGAKPLPMADRNAATAMALLPFLARGHSHLGGPFKETVAAGLAFLVDHVDADGKAYAGGTMYTQGLVALALARCYGMSRDKALADTAQRALDFIEKAQDKVGGGWRYQPNMPGDTSVLGWQISALLAGQAAGLRVDPDVIRRASAYLDGVQGDPLGTSYGYVGPGDAVGPSAIGLVVRSRTGWAKDDPRLLQGATRLVGLGIAPNLYVNYYLAHLLHTIGGDMADGWRSEIQRLLIDAQVDAGDDRGSWLDNVDTSFGTQWGRIYCTSLAALILETPLVTGTE